MISRHWLLFIFVLTPAAVCAAGSPYSGSIMGPLGLNTVPSARMDETSTMRAGVSVLDPYVHSYLGFQIADPLYIQLRQTAQTPSLFSGADRLLPGVDLKLRLLKETATRPEIAIGIQSAIGHKRMAGEYIAFSKRYKSFDFTGGIGWGRYAGGGGLPNPLNTFGGHFGGKRPRDGDMPAQPSDWFTGDSIGLFGGVEYFTPVKGLSLKFDIGPNQYGAEKTAFGFDPPPAWSAALSYKPTDWIEMSVGTQGLNGIMGRLTFTPNIAKWKTPSPVEDEQILWRRPQGEEKAIAGPDKKWAAADVQLNSWESAPRQYGRAAIAMSNDAGNAAEELRITPQVMNLRGPTASLMRGDFEKALLLHQGSPEEIWRHASFDSNTDVSSNNGARKTPRANDLDATLEQRVSLSEEDSGILTRTSLILGSRGPNLSLFKPLDAGYAVRFNLYNNLQGAGGDDTYFAERGVAVDRVYGAYTRTLRPGLHASFLGGYLEEKYGGAGGEILYRPFGSRFAVGAEAWEAMRRDPLQTLDLGFTGEQVFTGHLNAWYDIPSLDLTLNAKAGRYLAGDVGGTLGLKKIFKNGASLEGFVTVTNGADPSVFGGITHAYNGIRLNLPLGGGYKIWPGGAGIRVRAEPFSRAAGQTIDNPIPLYELTEPFSSASITRNWNEILP